MGDRLPSEDQKIRRRWINLGEMVAVGGLIISGLALWNSWRNDEKTVETRIVERPPERIPLVLRGQVEDGGRAIRLSAVEPAHALETVTIAAGPPGSGTAPFGSEPTLTAAMVKEWLPGDTKREGIGTLPLSVEARYIERGEPRTVTHRYLLSYGWTDGGLLRGKSLRITGIRRA